MPILSQSLSPYLPPNLFATPEDDRFQKLAKDYIEGLLQVSPELATGLGDHRFDDKLGDYSDEAEAKQLQTSKDFRQQLEQFSDLTKLTGPNSVDVRLLKDNIDYQIFGIEELKERTWNPLLYNESLANSLYLLVARDFAPAEKRRRQHQGATGKNPGCHRPGKGEPEKSASGLYRDRDRPDDRRHFADQEGFNRNARQSAEGQGRTGAVAGENALRRSRNTKNGSKE